MVKPRVFVGSSTEGEDVAMEIQIALSKQADVKVWSQGVFELGHGYLESLMAAVEEFDFGIFVLRPDDIVLSRGDKKPTVRDNILFELGLFMGRLGRRRAFIVYDEETEIPSDLHGIDMARYRHTDDLPAALGPACTRIRRAIKATSVADEERSSLAFEALIGEYEGTLKRLERSDASLAKRFAARGDAARLLNGLYGGVLFSSRALVTSSVDSSYYGNLMEWDRKRSLLRVAHFGGPYNESIITRTFELEGPDEGVASTAFTRGTIKIRNDMWREKKERGEERLKSMMSVPLESKDECLQGWIAVLNVDCTEDKGFPVEESGEFKALAERAGRIRRVLRRVNRLREVVS